MDNPARIYGIDLGTTYSCIAYVDENNRPVIIPGDSNRLVTPSVVFFEEKGKVTVGEVAKEYARVESDQTEEHVKAHMGDPEWQVEHHGESYRPEDISRYILAKLAGYAEAQGLGKVTDVVITVPQYFNAAQRTATQQAGELAGFTVHELIPEPTAAAVAYGVDENQDQTVMVYDLGGGTFDITVINLNQGNVKVVCTDGDHDLGGVLWDREIVLHLKEKWQEEHGFDQDPLDDPETEQDLWSQAERAKRALTERETAPMTVQHGTGRTRVELTRDKFDELTAELLTRTIDLSQKTLQTAKDAGHGDVDKILLVGGSTFMPQVKRRVESEFGIQATLYDPDQSVAKGAAMYASNLQIKNAWSQALNQVLPQGADHQTDLTVEQKREVEQEALKNLPAGTTLRVIERARNQEIINACSKNFGALVLVDMKSDPVTFGIKYFIKKNDPVPSTKDHPLFTNRYGQPVMQVQIIEANGDNIPDTEPLPPYNRDSEDPYGLPSNARVIGEAIIDLPPNLPEDSPVAVKFSLSEDGGRLTVEAQEQSTGRKVEAVMEEVGALNAEEMAERMFGKAMIVS